MRPIGALLASRVNHDHLCASCFSSQSSLDAQARLLLLPQVGIRLGLHMVLAKLKPRPPSWL